jgi:deoxyadenosine/deoxycytidine kinase
MNNEFPDYIVVEGPIGVGKTSLAKRLANTFNTELMLESISDNPFLPRFYEDPKTTALPTQLYFLFQRAKRIESLRQTDMFRPVQIADFLIEKDRLFAQVTLSSDEFDLYQQVYGRMTLEVPVPDLVIYLQAPVNVLLKRIVERGIDYERSINESYLKSIVEAYVAFFYNYTTAPLLIVNTADFDLVNGSHNYDVLIEYIHNLPPGKHYFNPKEI